MGKGYAICVAFLKLFEKIYAPLTAGLLMPFRDGVLAEEKRCELDRLYQPSATIWMRSSGPSVSRLPREAPQQKQNSRCDLYYGN